MLNPIQYLKLDIGVLIVCVPRGNLTRSLKKAHIFAQVWYPNHDKTENNVYTMEDIKDIEGADKEWNSTHKKSEIF